MTSIHLKISNDSFAVWLLQMLSSLEFVQIEQSITTTLEQEREAWLGLSAKGLAAAYGNNEPNYDEAILLTTDEVNV